MHNWHMGNDGIHSLTVDLGKLRTFRIQQLPFGKWDINQSDRWLVPFPAHTFRSLAEAQGYCEAVLDGIRKDRENKAMNALNGGGDSNIGQFDSSAT